MIGIACGLSHCIKKIKLKIKKIKEREREREDKIRLHLLPKKFIEIQSH